MAEEGVGNDGNNKAVIVGGDNKEGIPRDQSKGKEPIVTSEPEEQRPEETLRRERMAFVAPEGSSASRLTYYDNFAELVGEERLAELHRTDPGLLRVILRFKEEHVAERARIEEEIPLATEHEAELKDDQIEEMMDDEEEGPRMSATDEAKNLGWPGFGEDGVPNRPNPHLLVPQGFEPYKSKRESYGV